MVRERLEKAGVRFEPVINLSGLASLIGVLMTLATVVGATYVLHYRVGQLEKVQERSDKDHDALLQMQGDLKVIRAIAEKRSSVLFTPQSDLAGVTPGPPQKFE